LKAEIDFPDPVIEAIAHRVVESLRPLLARKLDAPDPILTVDQLAEYLGIRKQRIYEAVSRGTIPYFKVGKSLRFKKSSVDKWIESKSVPVASPRFRPLGIVK
jgi:excisionase family DNA binding protein